MTPPRAAAEVTLPTPQGNPEESELQQVVYTLSHDFGKYIRHIREFTKLLVEENPEHFSAEEKEYASMLLRAATNSQAMINGLLAFSRVTTRAAPFELIDSNQLFEEVRESLVPKIKETGAILTVSKGSLPAIMGDRAQLFTVWQELMLNALTVMPPKTMPHLIIESTTGADSRSFSITDNGIGIAPENHERIYTLFMRLNAEDEYPGIGAGLSVAKRIMQRHGGTIELESVPGKGSRFTFTLPWKQT